MKESLWLLFEEQITEEQDRKEADQEVMENPGMRWQWLGLLGSSEVSKKWSDSMYILQPKSNIQFKLRASEVKDNPNIFRPGQPEGSTEMAKTR